MISVRCREHTSRIPHDVIGAYVCLIRRIAWDHANFHLPFRHRIELYEELYSVGLLSLSYSIKNGLNPKFWKQKVHWDILDKIKRYKYAWNAEAHRVRKLLFHGLQFRMPILQKTPCYKYGYSPIQAANDSVEAVDRRDFIETRLFPRLTFRQRTILILMLKGHRQKEVARILRVTPSNISAICRDIRKRLNATSSLANIAH